jgi:hypothetical protein
MKREPMVDLELRGAGLSEHVDRMRAAGIDLEIVARDEGPRVSAKGPGRNALCPCGSGHKFKRCCGGKR